MPPREWRFRLQDILAAIQQVQDYTTGMDLESFAASAVVVDAVLYRIAVIGEAARAIPDEVKAQHRSIPWRAIQGMRNRLVHEYFGVRLETVWETIEVDLPGLVVLLTGLADQSDEDG